MGRNASKEAPELTGDRAMYVWGGLSRFLVVSVLDSEK